MTKEYPLVVTAECRCIHLLSRVLVDEPADSMLKYSGLPKYKEFMNV
jgi:hypothetical protein